jgi:ABC-type amino acid transport substrate-binding protein
MYRRCPFSRLRLAYLYVSAAALLICNTLAFAQSVDLTLTAEELQWIEQNPTIRVHNETNWPPYNFNVDGEPTGFSIDYMRLLAEQTGLEVEFVSGPDWNEFIGMMRSGDLDVMLNIVNTPARREFLLFTDAYAITSPVLAVQEQVTGLNSINDLAGRTACIPQGSSTEEFLRQSYPDLNLLTLSDATACLHAVADGRAFASVEGYSILNHLLESTSLRLFDFESPPRIDELAGRQNRQHCSRSDYGVSHGYWHEHRSAGAQEYSAESNGQPRAGCCCRTAATMAGLPVCHYDS